MPQVHASPTDPSPTHHVVLDLGGQKYGLILEKGTSGYSIDERTTEGSFGALWSQSSKKYGNDPFLTMMEQREWTDGRGVRNYEDSVAGYYDAKSAWSLTSSYLLPCPQWHRGTGYRVANQTVPGSVKWVSLLGSSLYISVSWAATGMTTAHVKLWVKRVGNPGAIKCAITEDSSGAPTGGDLASVTKTTADITDLESNEVDFAIGLAITGTNDIYVCGTSVDNDANHWEIGVNDSGTGSKVSAAGSSWAAPTNDFGMYYRVTPADVITSGWFFTFGTTLYLVTAPTAGTSQVFSIDDNGVFTEITGHGLTLVTGRPTVFNTIVYFPQGATVDIVRWDGGVNWSPDTGNKAEFFCIGHDITAGPQLYAFWYELAARASGVTWGTNLTFGSTIKCGDGMYGINSAVQYDAGIRIFKPDGSGLLTISAGVDSYTPMESTMGKAISDRNGATSIVWNGSLYYSWLNTMMREYGGTSEDVGQAWQGKGLPANRLGGFSCAALDSSKMYVGVEGEGADKYSSVQVFTGTTWMEIWRAPQPAFEVNDVYIWSKDEVPTRVWINAGADYFYFDLPSDVASPLNDSTMKYQHEFDLITSTFDDSAAALPKYIRQLVIASVNLNGSTIKIEVDYQTDGDIGTQNWTYAGTVVNSPEDTIKLHLGNIRAIRFRLRGITDNVLIPPVVEATVIDGFTRSPNRPVWNLRIAVGGRTLNHGIDRKATDLLQWLRTVSAYPGAIRMTSIFPELHNKMVIISPPVVYRENYNKILRVWKGAFTLSIMDMT
jgi:hypothetical protein